MDIKFPEPIDPYETEKKLINIPGVIETGLFTAGVTDVFVGYADGTVKHLRKKNSALRTQDSEEGARSQER